VTTFTEAAEGMAYTVREILTEAQFTDLLQSHPITTTILTYAGAGLIDVPEIEGNEKMRERCIAFWEWLISDTKEESND
jgi:hypothetical protein